MIDVLKSRVFWGVLLVLVGGLLLLQSLGVIPGAALLWALLLGVVGVVFLYVFLTDRESWWAAIPASALLGLAAAGAWGYWTPGDGGWSGALFLGSMGLGFVAVYLTDHERWWAVIPGGVLLTLALVAGVSMSVEEPYTGGLLFLGLAVTFAVLMALPTPEGRMRWPAIPAVLFVLLAALVTLEITAVLDLIWPLALMLGGAYLIFRAFRAGGGPFRRA